MLNPIQKAAIRHLVAANFSPPETRMTDTAWCEVMGIATRTLQKWKTLDEFKASLKAAVEEVEATSDPFAYCARQFALEQLVSMLTQKTKGGKLVLTPAEQRKTIKDILANTEHVAIQGDAVDYSEMTEEDLANLCLGRGVTPVGMTEGELKAIADQSWSDALGTVTESDSSDVVSPTPFPKRETVKTTKQVGQSTNQVGDLTSLLESFKGD